MALGLCRDNLSSGFGRKFREKTYYFRLLLFKFYFADENHSYTAPIKDS